MATPKVTTDMNIMEDIIVEEVNAILEKQENM